MQADVIANHPSFKERFADAELIEGTSKGWQLPFGSPRKGEKISLVALMLQEHCLLGIRQVWLIHSLAKGWQRLGQWRNGCSPCNGK